jgi:uncharacterized protein (DUF1697 family)
MTYISMLRAINVGGKQVGMEKLKRLYESLDFKNVRSYIQSGNVLFESPNSDPLELGNKIEKEISKTFGFGVFVVIRTDKEIQKIIENNPLSKKDPTKLHVTFLRDLVTDYPSEEIRKAKDKAEEFVIRGKEVYLFCPNGYGITKLSNSYFEKKMKTVATTRNWRTVNMFLAMSVSD